MTRTTTFLLVANFKFNSIQSNPIQFHQNVKRGKGNKGNKGNVAIYILMMDFSCYAHRLLLLTSRVDVDVVDVDQY